MSYILDALRKADAERERDPARGIHAQPVVRAPVPARTRWPVWVACGAVVLMAGAAWMVHRHEPVPAQAAAPSGGAEQEPSRPVAPPVLASAGVSAPVAETAVVPATAVLPAPPPMPVPAVVPPLPAPARAEAQTARASVAAGAAARSAALPAVPPPPAAQALPAPVAADVAAVPVASGGPAAMEAAPATGARVVPFAQLPADVQSALPKLAISGGVHSDNAAQRMLIVGGQVYNEGSELAPGLVLEQVRSKTAVLRYRTWRYSVGY